MNDQQPLLDPCGRPCDWIRSGYTTDMVFESGGSRKSVTWYFSKVGQPWAPDGNKFVSLNWDGPDKSPSDLGEQDGARPWSNGKDVKNYPLQLGDPCSIDADLVLGLTPGNTTGPWSPEGKLACCNDVDCTSYADPLFADIVSLSGCSSLAQTVQLDLVAPCVWQGTATTTLGSALMTVGFSMGTWFRSLDCFTGDPTWTLVSQVNVPLQVVWDVLDTAVCCGFSGTDTFRVTLHE